jgi:hypothetical protein
MRSYIYIYVWNLDTLSSSRLYIMASDRRGHANAAAIEREDGDSDELFFRQSRDVVASRGSTRTLLPNDRRMLHPRFGSYRPNNNIREDALGQQHLSSAWSERSGVAASQDGFTQRFARIHRSENFLGMGGGWPFDEAVEASSERNRGNINDKNALAGVPSYLYDSSSESSSLPGLGKDTTAIAQELSTSQTETVHSMDVSMFASIPLEQTGSRASEMNYLDQVVDSMAINGHTSITAAPTTQAIKIEPTSFTEITFEPPQEHARGLHLLEPGKIVSMPSGRPPEISLTLKPEERVDSKKSAYTGGQGHDPPLPDIPPFLSVPRAVLGANSVFEASLVSSLTFSAGGPSHAVETALSGAPKQILHGYYGKMEAKTQLSKNDYYTWDDDGGRHHDRRFTCIFLCPVSGERYPSCAYGQMDSYEVRVDHETDAEVVWYKQKIAAEHAAAVRACDCLCLRYRSPVRLGHVPPYYEEGDILLPSIPAEIKQRMESSGSWGKRTYV